MKPRQNEKKYHQELIDVCKLLGGWGYKAQRGFVKGTPDVELKTSKLPLCKIEVKHEVYNIMPKKVPVNLTELQRKRLRDMQAVGMACGWAVFVTVDKETMVYYSKDADAKDTYGCQHYGWSKETKSLTLSYILATMAKGSTP